MLRELSLLNTDWLLSAIFTGVITTMIVAWRTQSWIEGRERRNKEAGLRMDLYLEIVELICENEEAMAQRGSEAVIAPIALQKKRLKIAHKLQLLGSESVCKAYKQYAALVFQETAHPVHLRPHNPDEVVSARDILVEQMSEGIRI